MFFLDNPMSLKHEFSTVLFSVNDFVKNSLEVFSCIVLS